MVHIPDVLPESLLPVESVPSVYLGPAGQTGFDFVATGLLGRVAANVLHEEGPRSDKAHFALQNIPELGDFIQAVASQPLSELRKPLLVREQAALLVTC